MLIFGNRYIFRNKEKLLLEKKFNNVFYLSYSNKDIYAIQKELNDIVNKHNINTIILNLDTLPSNKTINMLSNFEKSGIKFFTIENFLEKYFYKCLIDKHSIKLSYLENIKPYSFFQYLQKRVIDYFMVVLLILPYILFAIATKYKQKKQSNGELLYKQKRVGKNNKEFICIKFRTMYINAEKNGPKFAKEYDTRAYPWGNLLRSNKMDELGQLINVIKGDMHFVGPRPERKVWINSFEKNIPYYNLRHIVAPGITGLAQLEYHYAKGTLNAKEKLMYDLYYIKHWSIWLDLKIIFKTAIFVLNKFR